MVCAPGLTGLACRSAAAWHADADRQVYEIVAQRRGELATDDAFTIDRPIDTLRARILEDRVELDPSGALPLGLGQCLEVAAENSRAYQDRRESLYGAALDLTLERWRFSYQETGSFSAFLHDDGASEPDTGVLSNLGITKLLGTGAQIVGDVSIDLVRDLGSADGWDAVSNLSLNVTQPLLAGFGSRVVEENLTQAERDVLDEARTYERFRRTFAFDVASRYQRILVQRATLANEQANRENLRRLRTRNESFAEAGRLSDIEVDQARQDELRAETRVVDAQRGLEAALDEFNLFLGLPTETPLALAEEPVAPPAEEDALRPTEEEAARIALELRLDHASVLARLADAERKVLVAADALRAVLNVSANANLASPEGRPLDLDADDLDATLSLDLDLPWERTPERNSHRAAEIRREASLRAVEESADSIRAELREDLRALETARENHRIQSGAVILAERRVESAALNLEAGRANTRDLLEAQESLLEAQNAEVRARIDYWLADLALARDMEVLRVGPAGISVDREPLLSERSMSEGEGR